MKIYLSIVFLLSLATAMGQTDMDKLLNQYNTRSIPYISVQELKMNANKYLILDTRKKEEYDVSHIPNAIWVSEDLDEDVFSFSKADKNRPMVVYCSVGVRSENFGEALKKKGFANVKNLYGSIFAWKDEGYEVHNVKEQKTDSVHVYSKVWGKYLKTGHKVY